MKYFHRTHLAPDAVLRRRGGFFGAQLSPVRGAAAARRRFAGTIGQIGVTVQAEGGRLPS